MKHFNSNIILIIIMFITFIAGNVCIIENKSTYFNYFLYFSKHNFTTIAHANDDYKTNSEQKTRNKKINNKNNKINQITKKPTHKDKIQKDKNQLIITNTPNNQAIKEKIKYTKFIGEDMILQDYRSFQNKIVILFFWSSWNVESVGYLKTINELNKEFNLNKVEDIIIIPISTSFQGHNFLRKFYIDNQIDTLNIYKDADTEIPVITENIKPIPSIFILNKEHTIFDLTNELKTNNVSSLYTKIIELNIKNDNSNNKDTKK